MSEQNSDSVFRIDLPFPQSSDANTTKQEISTWTEMTLGCSTEEIPDAFYSVDEWAVIGQSMVFQLDGRGNIVTNSGTVEQMLGYSATQLTGKSFATLGLKSSDWEIDDSENRGEVIDQSSCAKFLKLLKENAWVAEYDIVVIDADEQSRPVRCRGFGMADEQTHEQYYLVTALDFSVPHQRQTDASLESPDSVQITETVRETLSEFAGKIESLENLMDTNPQGQLEWLKVSQEYRRLIAQAVANLNPHSTD